MLKDVTSQAVIGKYVELRSRLYIFFYFTFYFVFIRTFIVCITMLAFINNYAKHFEIALYKNLNFLNVFFLLNNEQNKIDCIFYIYI